jgi:hypothetical protein
VSHEAIDEQIEARENSTQALAAKSGFNNRMTTGRSNPSREGD